MTYLLFLGLGLPEILLILFTAGIPFILMLICIIDLVRSEFKDSTTKLIWILIVLFLPMLGSLIYLLIGRNQKTLSDSRK